MAHRVLLDGQGFSIDMDHDKKKPINFSGGSDRRKSTPEKVYKLEFVSLQCRALRDYVNFTNFIFWD
jgi:hypothetical protein